jgi:hypothetical protein
MLILFRMCQFLPSYIVPIFQLLTNFSGASKTLLLINRDLMKKNNPDQKSLRALHETPGFTISGRNEAASKAEGGVAPRGNGTSLDPRDAFANE